MRKINVVIINGKPRSGKDTVIGYMKRYCGIYECARCWAYSTIDPVKNMLKALGWNGEKNDEVRNMLSSLKQFWINNNDGPLKYCMDHILDVVLDKSNTDDIVLIFQIREPAEIEKLVNALNPIKSAYGFNVSTLFVNRFLTEEKTYGNSSDADVAGYEYDAEIFNNGTLEELEKIVCGYMDNLLGYGGVDNE